MTITRLAPLSPPWSVAVTNRGPAGVGATVEIDPVVTLLEPGEPGEVVNLGNETHVVLKFSLAGGDEGPVGPRPLLTIGTVTTVENGNAADVNLSGADGEYAVNFTIPAGPVGPPPTLEIGDVTSGPTADADVTGGAGSYVLDLVLPVGPAPTLLPGVVTAVPNGSPLTITFNETGPGEYTVDLEVPAGPTGPPGSMSPGDSVTLLNMATARILGRTAGGAGVVQELTKTNMLSFLNVADGADVTAAAAFANDNRLLRSDGTGKGAQASDVTILDNGNVGLGSDAPGEKLVVVGNAYLSGTLDLGDSGDATLSRHAAGRVAVEGNPVAHVEELAFRVGTPLTATGASVTLTGLDCDDLLVSLEGVSHNDGSSRATNLLLSSDGGSTFPITLPLNAAIAAASLTSGIAFLTGLRQGLIVHLRGPMPGATDLNSVLSATSPQVGMVKATGRINAIRIQPAAGSFDAGTIYVSQRG